MNAITQRGVRAAAAAIVGVSALVVAAFGAALPAAAAPVTTIPVAGPSGLAVSPDGSRLYVAKSSAVVVIDTTTNSEIDRFPVSGSANSAALSADGSTLYVGGTPTGIVAIDTATGAITGGIPIGYQTVTSIALAASGSALYATGNGNAPVWVGDSSTDTLAASLATGIDPRGVAVTPDGAKAFVVGVLGVAVVDTANNTFTTATVGVALSGVVLSADGSRAYATADDGSIVVLRTADSTVERSIPVSSSGLVSVALSPDKAWLYATAVDGTVSAVNTATNAVVATIPAGAAGRPSNIVVSPNGRTVYASSYERDTLSVLTVPSLPGGALAAGTTGSAYDSVITASGFGPFSYSAMGLPAGLSIDPNSGAITGTPTAPGDYTVTATVLGPLPAVAQYTISVTAGPSSPTPPSAGTGSGSGSASGAGATAELAATGSELPMFAGTAALLLLIGGGVTLGVAARRRGRTRRTEG